MKRFIFISSILCLFFLGILFFSYIPFNNDRWLESDDPFQTHLDYLDDVFLPGEDIVLAFRLQDSFFNESIMTQFLTFKETVNNLDSVLSIMSPLDATVILDQDDSLIIEPYHDALIEGHFSTLTEYQQHFEASMYHHHLLSSDFKTVALVITIDNEGTILERNIRRRDVLSFVYNTIGSFPMLSDYALTGNSYVDYYMNQLTRSNLYLLLPISIVLVLLFLGLIFRDFLKVMMIASSVFFSLLICLGVIYLVNGFLSIVMVVLPLLIVVIAVADSVHILTRWAQVKSHHDHAETAIQSTFGHIWKACLLTSITTAIGFGSFYFSDMLPLKRLGLASFFTIPLTYGVVMGLMYVWMMMFKDRLFSSKFYPSLKPSLPNFVVQKFDFIQRFHKVIVFSLFALCALAIFGLQSVNFETNFLDVFFKKSSKIQQDTRLIDTVFKGSSQLSVIVQSSESDYFKSIDVFNYVVKFSQKISEHPYVNSVQSYSDPVSMFHKELAFDSSLFPLTEDELNQELLFLEFSRNDEKSDVLSDYIDFDYSNSHILIKTDNLSSRYINELIQYVHHIATTFFGANYFITGTSQLIDVLGTYVLNTHFISLFFSMFIIWIIMIYFYGLSLATIGLFANASPIILILGLINWLGIPFDFATVLIGSICFGICVDDTIHFLHVYYTQAELKKPMEVRIKHALRNLTNPVTYTTILLCVGFGVFYLSDIVLLTKFGLFSILSFCIALVMDLFFLPALLIFFKHNSKVS